MHHPIESRCGDFVKRVAKGCHRIIGQDLFERTIRFNARRSAALVAHQRFQRRNQCAFVVVQKSVADSKRVGEYSGRAFRVYPPSDRKSVRDEIEDSRWNRKGAS